MQQLCSLLNSLPGLTDVHVGQMVALGLEEIEARVGPERWAKMRDLVGTFVEKAIRQHCSETDTFLKTKDGGYVIVFVALTESAALARAATIAKEVNDSLFGEGGFEGAVLRGVVAEGGEWIANQELTPSAVADRLAAGAMRIEDTAEQQGVLAIKTPAASDSLRHSRSHSRFLAEMRRVERGPISQVYTPVWSVPANAIAAYQCLPARKLVFDDTLLTGYDVLPASASPGEIAKLDSETLDAGLMALLVALRAGRKTDLVVNIHFDTLSVSASRETVLESLRATPDTIRSRLFVSICGVPTGVPFSRVQELVQYLAPFCRGSCVLVRSDTLAGNIRDALGKFRQAGIKIVGIDLPGKPRRLDLSWTCSVLHTAQDLGLVSHAGNLRAWRDVLEMTEAGIELLSGPILGVSSAEVPPRKRFTLDDARALADQEKVAL